MAKVGVICEQIERLLKNSINPERKLPTKPEIALHVRQGLGYVMKGSAFDGSNIDGLFFADDAYTFTFKGIDVSVDADGLRTATLPELPITMPRGRGIVSVRPSGVIDRSYDLILRKDLDTIAGLRRNNIKRRIMCFQENKSIIFYTTGGGRVASKIDTTIVCPVVGGLDEELNISADTEAKIIEYVLNVYRGGSKEPESENTDGIDVV